MTDNVTRLPEPGVILDLDAIERPKADIKPPFVVNVEGRSIRLEDPAELDWRDLAYVNDPADLLRIAMERDDRVYLQGLALPAWKFNRFMEAYYTHYDLEDKILEAKRRAQLSGL